MDNRQRAYKPYALYLRKKYPEKLSAMQIEELQEEGTLKPYTFVTETTDKAEITLKLLPNSVNLVEMETIQ